MSASNPFDFRSRTVTASSSTPPRTFHPSSPPQNTSPSSPSASKTASILSPRRRTISNRRIAAAQVPTSTGSSSSFLSGAGEVSGVSSGSGRKRTKTETLAAALSASSLDQQQASLHQLPLLPVSSTFPCLSNHTRLPSGGPPKPSPLNITELLSLILGYLGDLSPATLAASLQVSKFWFDVGTGPLWRVLRFDDCQVIFDYATKLKESKAKGEMGKEDPAMIARFKLYSASVRDVHITEIVSSGDTVDVLILRRRYPLLVPFQNLRNVTLHRLSPHALYKEEFGYAVRSPGMWLDLASTKCCHQVNILSAPPNSYAARCLTLSKPIEESTTVMAPAGDPSALVWIQTSVFVHYQQLTEFVLDMPGSWSLDPSHALDLLRAIANSPNRTVLRTLNISCPLSPPSYYPPSTPISFAPSSAHSSDIKDLLPDAFGAMILGSLPNLEEVVLVASLEDKHVLNLARNWPKLRRFTLRTPPLRSNGRATPGLENAEGSAIDAVEASDCGRAFAEPKTTLASLVYLASLCPHLEHVEMDILPPTLVGPAPAGRTVSQSTTASQTFTASIPNPQYKPLQLLSTSTDPSTLVQRAPTTSFSSTSNSVEQIRLTLPVFPPSLKSLHLTGLSHMPIPLVLQIAIRSVPPTCTVHIERVELDGIGSLFPIHTDRAGSSMQDGFGDGPEVWARRIAYAKGKLKERKGRGWRPLPSAVSSSSTSSTIGQD